MASMQYYFPAAHLLRGGKIMQDLELVKGENPSFTHWFKMYPGPRIAMGLTAVVAKGWASVLSGENEKVKCLNNLKWKQENPMYYRGEFSHLVWKVIWCLIN